ncbi:MAG: hypothetical protein J6386_23455 [Candidatus Synoicihabitans palmerolidicus]|nr:hypothetical protein [Candidatus Synoicihabitans palmerolidicus]
MIFVAALVEACRQCDDPVFRPELIKRLTRREYLNQPAQVVAAGFTEPFALGQGRVSDTSEFIRFSGSDLNNPTLDKAQWLIDGFKDCGLISPSVRTSPHLAREIFRPDLFSQAVRRYGDAG